MVSSPARESSFSEPVFMRMNDPVPKVHLASPSPKQAWPNSAACWSPATPATGMPSGRPGTPRVYPSTPLEGIICGRISRGTSNRSSRPASHCRLFRFISEVREALDTSVTCASPPVRRQIRKLSTVPAATRPLRSARPRPDVFFNSQRYLLAEKYGSSTRPDLRCTAFSCPAARRLSQNSVVRRHCQTMALLSASPLWRSQSIAVSRWLVMPIATISDGRHSFLRNTARRLFSTDSQISSGRCSTQPGFG